jgi:hypothetical protein
VAARTSRAQKQAEETFEKESRRMAKAEENRPSDDQRVEAERISLLRAAEDAERMAEESTRSISNNSTEVPEVPEVPAVVVAAAAVDPRVERAAAERRDRELKVLFFPFFFASILTSFVLRKRLWRKREEIWRS